jgi:hypothetical protein
MALNNTSGAYAVNDWSGLFLRNNAVLDFLVGNGGTLNGRLTTSQVFRDFSAWYHIVVTYDSTNATNTERMRLYVNGSRVTAFSTATYPAQNTNSYLNSTNSHFIGQNWLSGATQSPFDGYLTEINFIDGQALTPSSFGETDAITGVWKPKKYAGTYGTNGFYLNFSDNSSNTATTIGKDNSGNGNNWTPNNISVTSGVTYDSMLDVPTQWADGGNGRGNYAVLSPIDQTGGPPTSGNLDVTIASGTSNCVLGTIAVTSGKWYWEVTVGSTTNANWMIGIADSSASIASRAWTGANGWYYFTNGNKYNNNSGSSYGASYTTGDVIGIALDMDAGTVVFYKNNTSQGTAYSGLTGKIMQAALGNGTAGGTQSYNANFGQRPFAYTPPTGFKALNTQNLPAPTILKGNQYFDVSLYTGNATARSITGVGFRPDFVWTKSRSGAESHRLYDAVRGATQSLYSNLTNAEATEAQSLTAFNSDGFSLGTGAPNSNAVTYAAWQWKANGSAVTNTSGSITSQVNAGTSQGFSVVTYTGNGSTGTVGHGLGVAPSMIVLKRRDGGSGFRWPIYHRSIGAGAYLYLESTDAQSSVNAALTWGNNSTTVAPTSSVFTIGSAGSWNSNTGTYVAYCFSEVAGFSKFGSYTGNGSADGPFVFCGFRPRFVMIKRTDTGGSWYMIDTARGTVNVVNPYLIANGANAEATDLSWDLLSNGFKLRSTYTEINASSGTFIYAAFAESPFKNSLAR